MEKKVSKSNPMRRCIVCRESKPQEELFRITLKGDELMLDGAEKRDGRGMYVCRDAGCISQIVKRKAFNRACRRNFEEKVLREIAEELLKSLKEGTDVEKG